MFWIRFICLVAIRFYYLCDLVIFVGLLSTFCHCTMLRASKLLYMYSNMVFVCVCMYVLYLSQSARSMSLKWQKCSTILLFCNALSKQKMGDCTWLRKMDRFHSMMLSLSIKWQFYRDRAANNCWKTAITTTATAVK